MGDFVTIYRVWNDPEAQVIKALLESSGIRCKLVSHVPHSVYPVTVNGLAEVRIMVPREQEAEARALIAAYREEGAREEEEAEEGGEEEGREEEGEGEPESGRGGGQDHD